MQHASSGDARPGTTETAHASAEAALARAAAELALPPGPATSARVVRYERGVRAEREDRLATEEPLELRLRAGGARATLAITMRTPGHDFELAAGFLHGEGLIASRADLRGLTYCVDRDVDAEQRFNIVNADLAATALPTLEPLERHFATTSACGICGKASLEALELRGVAALPSGPQVAPATIARLPERLRAAQGVFAQTGGLHAAALFTSGGELVAVREDVGRHNALDKLVGWALLEGRLPLAEAVVLLSGASYELVQKALVARVPVLCAVSAPSSLAVDLARRFGMTLAGFVRDERFNVYAGDARIAAGAGA